jgi:hypothetical protein
VTEEAMELSDDAKLEAEAEAEAAMIEKRLARANKTKKVKDEHV